MLGGHRVGERQRRLEPAGGDQGERRVGDARALRDELGDQLRDPVEEREVRGGDDQRAVFAVLPLGAEVKRDPARGFAVPSATTISSLGPAIPSTPTFPQTSRLASVT